MIPAITVTREVPGATLRAVVALLPYPDGGHLVSVEIEYEEWTDSLDRRWFLEHDLGGLTVVDELEVQAVCEAEAAGIYCPACGQFAADCACPREIGHRVAA